ncbi:MAG: hypothetical protein HXX08_13210 [Chloroflexi bacterium]|uniref:Uncharacterized protein n=1 Tax=Candidatus Chlorohelix allophototropha TaxID=3003348 RepID=A0A8T7M405_9CHLR|nr:hypothetical protein [Chloroflexota bacterium]WJW70195.1 hypothetical protein OZ401_004703 [Chloroflexota bacterium L227-S17]
MFSINPDIVKAEIDYRCNAYHNEAHNMRLYQLAKNSSANTDAEINPMRKKLGKLLIRWGMQLAGYTL